MVKFCNYCGLEIHAPDTFLCAYCDVPFCIEHRLVEDHECSAEKTNQITLEQTKKTSIDWMYDCLEIAKYIIKKHHHPESADFDSSQFVLFIARDQDAYGCMNLEDNNSYKIGIHYSLSAETPENTRMLVIVLVHQLLHLIHQDWEEDKIRPEEKRLANQAGYYDSMRNMQVLYLDKMKLCGKQEI